MTPALSQRLPTFICLMFVFLFAAPTNACINGNCPSPSASNFFQQPLCATESSFFLTVARFVSKNTLRDYTVGNDSTPFSHEIYVSIPSAISVYNNYAIDFTATFIPKAPTSNAPSTTPLSRFDSTGLRTILPSLLGSITLPITSFRTETKVDPSTYPATPSYYSRSEGRPLITLMPSTSKPASAASTKVSTNGNEEPTSANVVSSSSSSPFSLDGRVSLALALPSLLIAAVGVWVAWVTLVWMKRQHEIAQRRHDGPMNVQINLQLIVA